MSSVVMEEYELMKDSKYRVYVSAVDKALKNFEYTSEWADLISALGKLNKAISSNTKFQVIPRRIKISKRLAQCMHPALPAGVHLRALEIYDVIFRHMGTARLSSELFIYSAGLFPLLGHAAMNVRPPLLTVYETHFVPLGKRLGPALSGFLSGVLPGLEEGSDHFDRTNSLLEKVCEGVGPAQFYTCLWECLASNAKIRLPAISYILVHFNKAEDKLFIMGINTDIMVIGLCACVLDSSVLVQRCALDLLLVCFPMHNSQLIRSDTVRLMTAALSTLLRRDMSLNRRLFGWLLGSEVNVAELHGLDSPDTYFQLYSREILVEAIKSTLTQVVAEAQSNVDFRPYRLLVVLIDRPDIGPIILDDILYDVFRSLYHARSASCSVDHHGLEILHSKSSSPMPQELFKAINMLFNSLEPAYIWQYAAEMIGKAFEHDELEDEESACVQPVGSGPPRLTEVCWLVGCLMDATSLETYVDTTCQHLPLLFLHLVSQLTNQHSKLSPRQLATCLKLAAKILSRVQPPPPPRADTIRQKFRTADGISQSSDGSHHGHERCPLQRSRDLSLSENHLEAEAALKIEHPVNRSASADARLDMIRSKTPDGAETTRSESPVERVEQVDQVEQVQRVQQDDEAVIEVQQQSPTLEQCRQQYKELFVALVGNSRMIDWGSMDYSVLFKRLQVTGPAVDGQCSLEHLLQHCLGETSRTPKAASSNNPEGAGDIVPQLEALLEGGGVEWEEVLRLACSLLVDLSAFPSFNKIIPTASVCASDASEIPPWLQILAVCSCWLGRTPVMQLMSIATLLDLIATVSSNKTVPSGSSGSVVPVILAPLLEASHVQFLEHKTHVLQVVARWLWHHLGASSTLEARCVSLLQQLHDCASSCEAVESAIAESLGLDEPRNQLEAFQRFATLWHASRDLPTKGCHHRPFQKSLLRMLDNLWLDECGPLRLTAQSWLLHSLLRGDATRLLDPLLLPLVSPTTARVSVLRVTVRLRSTVQAAKIYAISTLDGSVIYHISPSASDKQSSQGSTDSDPVRAKRIFAVKTLARRRIGVSVIGTTSWNSDVDVAPSSLHSWALPSVNGSDSCLLVSPQLHPIPSDPQDNGRNRGGSASSSSSNISSSSTTATGSLSKEESLRNGVSSTLHVGETSAEGSGGLSVSVHNDGRLVLDGPYSQKLYSGFEEGDDEDSDRFCSSIATECDNVVSGSAGMENEGETELDESFTAEDYFNKINLSGADGGTDELKREAKSILGLHPIHSHMLLYCGVYDSARTLYALRTLRNALATNPRAFLTCAATTGVPKSSSELLTLLARHRKSVFGHSFHGDIGISSTTTRSHMYLEVLISACLYLTRAYYPSLGQTRLTTSEIIGNQQVQVASLELLSLVMSELTSIVRDSGQGLANYIADLLARCKVQKVVLHCLVASVHDVSSASNASPTTFTEEIVRFNDPGRPSVGINSQPSLSPHAEAFQIQLLRLLLALIILEHQVKQQKGTWKETSQAANSNGPSSTTPAAAPTTNGQTSDQPQSEFKYLPGKAIPQQPMFLAAVLSALMMQGQMCWLHQHWTTLVTCALPFMGPSLARVVLSVVRQLCENLRSLTPLYLQPVTSNRALERLPVDYTVTQLEALTVLVHYCLLDKGQQPAHSLNQPLLNSRLNGGSNSNGLPGVSQTAQIFNNLVHVFLATPLHHDAGQDSMEPLLASRHALLFNLPQILACTATLWHAVSSGPDREEWQSTVAGSPRIVRHHLLEFLSPISLHHATNFLAAVAVVWHDRRRNVVAASPSLPQAPPPVSPLATSQITQEQKVLVQLLGAIRVMPIDTLVKTLQQVLKSPPAVHGSSQNVQLEVSALELLLAYLREASASPLLSESWSSVLALLRDGLQPGLPPPVSLLLLAVLNEFVQLCQPSLPERRDLRDLQDITAKLVEACKDIMQACLEQAAFMRRQYVVKEDQLPPANHVPLGTADGGTAQFVVQTQQVLAEQLASLLDVTFGSQEKERVIDILCSLMVYITPFLRLHTPRNAPSFYSCSGLLASITSFQYTRRAWRREVLDLLLDSAMFQMEARSLPHWRTIVDNLMTHDTATFRDLLGRVTVSQGNSLGIFSNREQEYEQRAQVLKRLAFVILCSDMDQYQKYMPEIQEKLAESLRLPQVVPAVQANVFLCFRVLLLRMSPHHVTSLWPVIISEMVQVFLQMEHELSTDSEQFSSHIRLMSGLDLSWVSDRSNGLHARGHPHWLHLQLATVHLLYLSLHLPADHLPQFQMYRWAFVGSNEPASLNNNDLSDEESQSPNFVPHVTRIARLMDAKFEGPVDLPPGSALLPSTVAIRCLQELHPFFSALSGNGPHKLRAVADSHVSVFDLEKMLEADFLDAMPNK